jgi:hypothetical protein
VDIDHAQLLGLTITLFLAWPTLLLAVYGWLQTRVRRRDRAEDQRDRAAVAAQLADTAETTRSRLDRISEAVVDGDLLLSLQRELDATRTAITTIEETLRIKSDTGIDALPETHSTLVRLQKQEEALVEEIRRRSAR